MKHGFTLIELLVVVLIIGILASIAVPQYKLVVEKSRTSEAIQITKAIGQAAQRYYEATSIKPNNFEMLDVQIPGTKLANDTYRTKDYVYTLIPGSALFEVAAARINQNKDNSNATPFNSNKTNLALTYVYVLPKNPTAEYQKIQIGELYCAILTTAPNLKPWHRQVCANFGDKVVTLTNKWEYYKIN